MRIWSVYIIVEISFLFQLLGECHCWWTKESSRSHVAKFYGRLQLIRSVLRASTLNFRVFKIHSNCNFVGKLHHPFWLNLVLAFWGIHFQLFKLLSLAKDHCTSVPAMCIWYISLIKSDLKWCIHLSRSLFFNFNYLVSVTAGGSMSPRGHM